MLRAKDDVFVLFQKNPIDVGWTVSPYQCITLLTDYGLEDGFVASCHGVIARIVPDIRIIDITHLVPPGDVRRGAAVLAQTVGYLPVGVHVVVVDPGVGTPRRALAVQAGERVFVGPDNGVLSWALRDAAEPVRAYRLTNPKLWVEPVSATFHGRDMFAPVGAHLAAGLDIDAVGDRLDVADLVMFPPPTRRVNAGMAEGEVITADRFGNVQLSVTAADLDAIGVAPGTPLAVTMGGRTVSVPYRTTFASVAPDGLVGFVDSTGRVALAVNAGSAAQRLGLPPGAHVRLAPAVPGG